MDIIFKVVIPIVMILIIIGFDMKKFKERLNSLKENQKNCSNCKNPCHTKMSCNRKAKDNIDE